MNFALPPWLAQANQTFAQRFPGDTGARRPVHVVYGGAHLFQAALCAKLGQVARRIFLEYAPEPGILLELTDMGKDTAAVVYERVLQKLAAEPVEDYRIDFEDGYGNRPDEEEDQHAENAARELAKGLRDNTLPPFIGIRMKPLDEQLKARSFRTLDRFFNTYLDASGGLLPPNFVVTLPKVTVPEQVRALAEALAPLPGVGIEIMMETPQALQHLPELVDAAQGRCTAVHFGPYDYTASLGITAANQLLAHPVCDLARQTMQVALGGTGIGLSDGPTTVLPIAPHRGEALGGAKHAANRDVVHRAWRLHYNNVRRALDHGFYQGWDLHPAQLPLRYAAVYGFFLEGLPEASTRLRNFMDKAAQATRVGNVFDDAATGQGLLNYFLRAARCGAIPEADIPALSGLSLAELNTCSFARIIETRRAAGA